VDEYLDALERELAIRLPRDGEPLATLYLGGGTPSRLGGEGVARLVELVRQRRPLASDVELTIEANPEDVTRESAERWRAAGVNRLSLGAQSFDDDVLAWMHRTHRGDAVISAVTAAREAGIADVSLDLIFALPDPLGRDWARDLERAIALEPTHVSLYGLTVEPRTPLGRWTARGSVAEAPEERYESELLLAHERLTAADFEHYEVSNYAKPGRRARHNSS
jgi:oxygen-independent coproporphyrinogen-3 oxidase